MASGSGDIVQPPAGSNYRIIPGKQKKSRIYVKEPFTYIVDKSFSSIDTVYLRCRSKTCSARAVIVNNFLRMPDDRSNHSCNENESLSLARITALELVGKMKMRAELETASFYVSLFFILYDNMS